LLVFFISLVHVYVTSQAYLLSFFYSCSFGWKKNIQEKESLITELRKELRVSDEEHRELLSRVNADEMIRRIREWRKANSLQSSVPQLVHDAPSPAVSGSRKKQKTSQSIASLAMGPPSPSLHPSMQPSSSALRRGGPPPGPKTKKPKTVSHDAA
jgi:hypothetical protein